MQKWYLAYEFYDSAGALIGDVKLPMPQTVASTGAWVADTNSPGESILPKDSWKTIIKFVAGKNATGTVWVDDVMFYGRAGQWAGQDWDTNLEYPTGWYYWLPPNGGNDGVLDNGFENTVVTTEAAHSGLHSLKFDLPFDRQPHDGFVGTRRVALDPGGTMATKRCRSISRNWPESRKATSPVDGMVEGEQPGAGFGGDVSGDVVGGVHAALVRQGREQRRLQSVIGASDYTWQFPAVTSFDWTPYTLDVTVPATVRRSWRFALHVYSRFTGTIYWDDLTVEKLDVPQITEIGGFEGTLPAFWNEGNLGGSDADVGDGPVPVGSAIDEDREDDDG